MPRKKYSDLPFPERMRRLLLSGVDESPSLKSYIVPDDEVMCLASLDDRVHKILGIIGNPQRKATDMLFFVMYDIESNKVRKQIAKYLIEEGCSRIQHSIFLGDLPHAKVDAIRNNLAEVQACYENHDSILVVPISSDYLQAMKIIGKSINLDVIMKIKNTLFF